jgi:hypothetical protein
MALVIATFLAVFVIICAVGFLFIARSEGRNTPLMRAPRTAEERKQQNELEQKMLHTIAWMRRLRGAPPAQFAVPLRPDTNPRIGEKVLLGCILGGIAIAVAWAMIAGGLWLLNWIEGPLLDPIVYVFFRIFTLPYGAAALAVAVLATGLPFAKRFRRPDRFRTGIFLFSMSIGTFWPLQAVAASFDLTDVFRDIRWIPHAIALFISGCLVSAGFECVRRAFSTPEDDSWEFMR